jgi:hypothetical protein
MKIKNTKMALIALLVIGQSALADGSHSLNLSQLASNQPADFKNAIQLANWRPMFGGDEASPRYRSRSFSAPEGSPATNSSWFGFRGMPSVPEKGPANPRGTIVLNPRTLTWAAYDTDGDLVKSGRASLGRDWCPDTGKSCRTPTGQFHIYSYKGADCVSKKYPIVTDGGAPMPYCMFFHGGYAIHGAYSVPDWNDSHGCVRVTPSAAQWMEYNFASVGTTVVIKPY